MSNRTLDKHPGQIGPRRIPVQGSFVPLTGAGTVLATAVKGLGFGYAPNATGVMALRGTAGGNNPVPSSTPGIVRSTTGTYTITLEDPYQDIEYASAHLAGPSTGIASGGKALEAQVVEPVSGLATANTAPTVTIVIVDNTGTVAECVASCRLYFQFVFRDSTVRMDKP